MKRYELVAVTLRQRLESGLYQPGDRLPSIRDPCAEFAVSVSTVQTAYAELEAAGLVAARPKSGYFALARARPGTLPAPSRPAQRPLEVSQWDQVLSLVNQPPEHGCLLLGSGSPDTTGDTLKPLRRSLSRLYRLAGAEYDNYDSLVGSPLLRLQLARLAGASGTVLHEDDIVITSGCQEALSIAIRTLTSPGDVVAVDSPSFYGSMQTLKAQGLKALELPTDPQTGISLEALELALEQWPIKAIQVTPTHNNPLGYTMPDARKRALVALARRFDVAIIEDDVYGDLAYTAPRPRTIKSWDEDGRVLLCSGFSKTLMPSMRLGWIAPGRYRDQVLHMKYVSTGTTAIVPQLAVAEFIESGQYERHLRHVVRSYQRNLNLVLGWIHALFPADTAVSCPQGGFVLWLELTGLDCVRLNDRLVQQGVQVAPGVLFSASGKYRDCLRINFTRADAEVYAGLQRMADEIATMRRELEEQVSG
ncbi:PLP-dependent aminotransferase family protein [Halopseudomonas sp.]|uniref:aminotransferase-like domain-containing protein n=1 Tax=Halopseudomonas sp. TaxID=2901191 RepID=UPI00311D5E3E